MSIIRNCHCTAIAAEEGVVKLTKAVGDATVGAALAAIFKGLAIAAKAAPTRILSYTTPSKAAPTFWWIFPVGKSEVYGTAVGLSPITLLPKSLTD